MAVCIKCIYITVAVCTALIPALYQRHRAANGDSAASGDRAANGDSAVERRPNSVPPGFCACARVLRRVCVCACVYLTLRYLLL